MDDGLIGPGRPFNYRARDADALLASMRELIPTVLPEWTDHGSEADFGRVLLELFAHMGDILGYYTDAVANESYLGTAQSRRSVIEHLRLIGYRLSTAAPAAAALTLALPRPPTAPVRIVRGNAFATASTPDAPSVRFEYNGAQAFELAVHEFVPGGTGVVATRTIPVEEGRLVTGELIGRSDGRPHQRFPLVRPRLVLGSTGRAPDLTLDDGSPTAWTLRDTLAFSGPADPDFLVEIDDQDRATVVFGERVPPNLALLRATYRVGGGAHGNVGPGTIATIAEADQLTLLAAGVVNAGRATGGADRETIEHAVAHAPRVFRSLGRAVTTADFEAIALGYGGVGKVRARPEWGGVVRLFVAPQGGGRVSDVLRGGLIAHFEDRRSIGTRVEIRSVTPVPIFVSATVDIQPYYSTQQVTEQVRRAVRGVLAFDRVSFGEVVYLSKFFEAIEAVDGVAGVNITQFARPDQLEPVHPDGKIAVADHELPRVPEAGDFTDPAEAARYPGGVRLVPVGGFA
jgi:hypothetical protein